MTDNELSPEALAAWQQENREYLEYLKKRYPERYEVMRLRYEIREVIYQIKDLPECDGLVERLESVLSGNRPDAPSTDITPGVSAGGFINSRGKLQVEATDGGGAIVWLLSHADMVLTSWILSPGNRLKVAPLGIPGELTRE